MTELRRIYIESERIEQAIFSQEKTLKLTRKEAHYLKRVLRLKESSEIIVVDGFGHSLNALLRKYELIEFFSNEFSEEISKPKPLIGVAVVVPKQGFDVFLRMSCEIGIDIIQPLYSDRSVAKFEDKHKRWNLILREALEQSERMWIPDLLQPKNFREWCLDRPLNSKISIAAPRVDDLKELYQWISSVEANIQQIWVAIGPEGGWTEAELFLAKESQLDLVGIGNTILRTSTAAIVATSTMIQHRPK